MDRFLRHGRCRNHTFPVLRCLMHHQQRAMHHWGEYSDKQVDVLRALNTALCEAWESEWPEARQQLADEGHLSPPG